MLDVARWLAEQGLGHHAEAFAENGIGGDVLRDLTDADLKELGLNLGDRRRLLKAIAALDARATQEQSEPGELTTTPAVPREPERRQLTVMFCDLVGSTALSTQLDPEDMHEVIRTYQGCCAEVVKRWDGHVAKYMGDGVLAYFGWPQAHEDDAERAVRTGLELTEKVGRQTADGARLAVRVGIATGTVMVGDLIGKGAAQEEAVVGETPNLAARLQGLAAPGAVVIAGSTRRLLGDLFALTDLGPMRLKGFAEPLAAFQVEGEGRAEGRFEALHGGRLTPLIGREHELAMLIERWAWARDGEGQVVLISGEPGIGKSRLLQALRHELGHEPHIALSHFCSPHHTNSALHPIIMQLERAAAFASDDEPEAKIAKLETLLDRATETSDDAVPLLAALLGLPASDRHPGSNLSPQRRKQRTLEVLIEQLAGVARDRPVLELYEDLHWVDPSTLELLDLLVERVRDLPVLAVLTCRPEFTPPWTGRAHVTFLTLNRLGRRQGSAIIDGISGGKSLPAEVVDQIIAKTDGVPLFVEELTKTVMESGLLTDAGDRYEIAGLLPPLAIPATLHDSLMARLDRHAPVKEVAQTAAVIGREFAHDLLAAVAPLPEANLNAAIDRLVEAELIFRRGTPPTAAYSFKHALVRDAAYGSILKGRRRAVHARIAAALEARGAPDSEVGPLELVHHHLLADAPQRALAPLQRAAERAAAVGATAEAMALYRKAVELLVHVPDLSARQALEAELLVGLGIQTQLRKGAGAAEPEAMFERALLLATGQGSGRTRFSAAWNLWRVHNNRGNFEKARAAAGDLTLIGRDTGEAEFVLQAHHSNWTTLEYTGEIQAALDHVERARRDAAEVPDGHASWFAGHDAFVCGAGTAAHAHLLLGRMADAEREIGACLARAERLDHSPTLGNALDNAITYGLLRRDHDILPPLVQRILELSEPEGLLDFVALGRFARGWTVARGGAAREGETDMRAAIVLAKAAGSLFHVPAWLALLAETLADAGRLVEAEELSGMALEQVNHIAAGTIHESEVRRIRGRLAARCGRGPEAIEHFAKAIATARHSGAKLLELRAATSLARLWAEQGERRRARDLLAPIYDWFTEGFDTPDLIEAKALLEELQ